MHPKTKIIAALLVVAAGLAAFAGCFFMLIMLGIFTDAIAPDATGPQWWCQTLEWSFYCLPLWGGIVALYSGWRVFRWNEHRTMRRAEFDRQAVDDVAGPKGPVKQGF